MARRLSHGTRSAAAGSHVFTRLASVIDTCRQRGQSPGTYLATAITDRRAGFASGAIASAGGLNGYGSFW